MIIEKLPRKTIAAACVLAWLHSSGHATNSVSAEFGTGTNTTMVRVGVQSMWKQQWLRSGGMHISGYWDLTLAHWHGDRYRNISGNTQNITAIGITPVFRLQDNRRKGLYAEAGIGMHYLSELYNNGGHELSTRFQFGDHLGVGYVFENNVDVALKIQHFSNGGIKSPNDGVNFAVIRVSYPF